MFLRCAARASVEARELYDCLEQNQARWPDWPHRIHNSSIMQCCLLVGMRRPSGLRVLVFSGWGWSGRVDGDGRREGLGFSQGHLFGLGDPSMVFWNLLGLCQGTLGAYFCEVRVICDLFFSSC